MLYVIISKDDSTTCGPFTDEDSAINWAKKFTWQKGYVVRRVHPVNIG